MVINLFVWFDRPGESSPESQFGHQKKFFQGRMTSSPIPRGFSFKKKLCVVLVGN